MVKGISLEPVSVDPIDNIEGSMWDNSSTSTIRVYIQGSIHDLVTDDQTQTLTNKTLVAPNLGTPTVLVGTNITGTAADLTAGSTLTNANLTGDVTSIGNTTTIVATTNDTLVTLNALTLPGTQVSGDIAGNSANVNATSNSTLTTLSALSLPGSQVTGAVALSTISGNTTATSNSTITELTVLSLPGSQITGDISGNSNNINGTSNSTITTLTALSLPSDQLIGSISVVQGGTGLSSPGLDGYVLTSNGTVWVSAPSGGGGGIIPVTEESGNYSILTTDRTILFTTGTNTLTAILPTAVSASGQMYTITKVDYSSGTVNIATTSGQTIGGRPSGNINLYVVNDTLTVISDGDNWQIISKKETEYIVAVSNTGFHIISSLSEYAQLSGNSLALGIGQWRVSGYITVYVGAGSSTLLSDGGYSGFYSANGAANAVQPAGLTGQVDGVQYWAQQGSVGTVIITNDSTSQFQMTTPTLSFTYTSATADTIYLVPQNNQSSGTVIVAAVLWAERIW
jgi:hypothetical protein